MKNIFFIIQYNTSFNFIELNNNLFTILLSLEAELEDFFWSEFNGFSEYEVTMSN